MSDEQLRKADEAWRSIQRPISPVPIWTVLASLFATISFFVLVASFPSAVDGEGADQICGAIGAATGYLGILLSLLLGRGGNGGSSGK